MLYALGMTDRKPYRINDSYLIARDGSIRDSKGRFVSSDVRDNVVFTHYQYDDFGRLHRPDGKLARKQDYTYKQSGREKRLEKLRGQHTTGTKPITEFSYQDNLEFKHGKFLSRRYYYNFECHCELENDTDSPVTYIEPDTKKGIVKHYYGYSTESDNDRSVATDALEAHNKDYPKHACRKFKLIEKKKAGI